MGQLEFTRLERKPDKNNQWRGGARAGAGRPKLTAKQKRDRGPVGEPHKKRAIVRAYEPQHIVLRTVVELGSFRKKDVFRAINEASFAAYRHEDSFRICEFSIQDFHLHLIVEANDNASLARGMKAFSGSVTKHVNALINRKRGTGERRVGSVFRDRYFVVALKTPKQVRNTLAYVLRGSTRIRSLMTRSPMLLCDARTQLLRSASAFFVKAERSTDRHQNRALHLLC